MQLQKSGSLKCSRKTQVVQHATAKLGFFLSGNSKTQVVKRSRKTGVVNNVAANSGCASCSRKTWVENM